MPWIVGVSGASGTPYAAAVLRALLAAGEAVDLVVFIDEEARLAAGRKVREVMAVRGFDHTTMTYQVDYL